MDKIRVGISAGDVNGVGMEVIIKSLADSRILDYCVPIIYAATKVVSYHKNIVKPKGFDFQGIRDVTNPYYGKVNVLNVWTEDITINLGQPSDESGKFAYTSLDRAVQDLKAGHLDTLVTAPFNKHVMQSAGFPYPGHTEYLTEQFEADQSLMLMVQDDLRIGVVTNHIPVSDIAASLSKSLIYRKAQLLLQSLQVDFGIERPQVAILGLNPHAGDQGTLGSEDEELIRPVVEELARKGHLITGPHSADGFFGSGAHSKADGILAMYHDQGLIPFKTLSFGKGVNYTAGLSIVRTSPDHGTGFNLAGKNIAEPNSFRNALFLALDIFRNRKNHEDAHQNRLKRGVLAEDTGKDEPVEESSTHE